jgi:hypothetical protein
MEEGMRKFAALLCACGLTLAVGAAPALAQNPANNSQVAQTSAESTLNNCLVHSVAALSNRVHIQCSAPAVGTIYGIRYFAVENTVAQNAMALSILSVANAAMQQNRSLTIIYRSNPNDNPAGCNANDCRRIVGVIMN